MTILDIDRTAPVIVRQEVTVDASIELLWRLHTDVNRWTSWRSDVGSARLPGPFAPGAVFHWATGGLEIASAIQAVDPGRRTVWGGPAGGIVGIHVWSFSVVDDGVRIVTEESWSGEPIAADPARAQSMLDASIAVWLRDLERAAAARQG
ncbi:SRPBCC family protein [Amycolatopsis sp. NBC_00345]|uniref:SRPBCC family protein n=1 Tax=Amycolatopsis sp. NBC_00345 TaxID=2975955 RepID=UPI002E271EC3